MPTPKHIFTDDELYEKTFEELSSYLASFAEHKDLTIFYTALDVYANRMYSEGFDSGIAYIEEQNACAF